MSNDEPLPKLPDWKEFRNRRRDEDLLDYIQAKFEHDINQERERDHWFMSVFTAMIGNVDLLHRDLMGDGTMLRPGILPKMAETQQELKRAQKQTQEQMPELIRNSLVTNNATQQAEKWTAATKWVWGIVAAVAGAVVAALIIFVVTGGHP